MGAGRVLCGIGTRGSPLQARHQQRRGRARARGAPARRRLDAVRGGASAGRRAADERLPPRRRSPRERRRRHADGAAQHDPGRRVGHQPKAGLRRGRPRVARVRAPAGRDGDPHPVPRGHRRGLRVPGDRGVLAGRPDDLPPARVARGRDQGAHPPARRARRSQAQLRGAHPRRPASAARSPRTSTGAA